MKWLSTNGTYNSPLPEKLLTRSTDPIQKYGEALKTGTVKKMFNGIFGTNVKPQTACGQVEGDGNVSFHIMCITIQ